tara:strand:+ start:105 stop:680 length:576 start_codon:yes stop_codon:yes gene_type:complete
MPDIGIIFYVIFIVWFFYWLASDEIAQANDLEKVQIKETVTASFNNALIVAGEPVIDPYLRDEVRLAYSNLLQNLTSKGTMPCHDVRLLSHPKSLIKIVIKQEMYFYWPDEEYRYACKSCFWRLADYQDTGGECTKHANTPFLDPNYPLDESTKWGLLVINEREELCAEIDRYFTELTELFKDRESKVATS